MSKSSKAWCDSKYHLGEWIGSDSGRARPPRILQTLARLTRRHIEIESKEPLSDHFQGGHGTVLFNKTQCQTYFAG